MFMVPYRAIFLEEPSLLEVNTVIVGNRICDGSKHFQTPHVKQVSHCLQTMQCIIGIAYPTGYRVARHLLRCTVGLFECTGSSAPCFWTPLQNGGTPK